MITVQPIMFHAADPFDLWPVVECTAPPYHLALNGSLSAAEVGTAVMLIASSFPESGSAAGSPDLGQEETLEAFLNPLIRTESVLVFGGLRVTDPAAGIVLTPGCACHDLCTWRELFDGYASNGVGRHGCEDSWLVMKQAGPRVSVYTEVHPDRDDETVVEIDESSIVVIDTAEVEKLRATVERDISDFLELLDMWCTQTIPRLAHPVRGALTRAFGSTTAP